MVHRLLFLSLVLAAGFDLSAQDTVVPIKKHGVVTNPFGANWFVSGAVDLSAAYTSQETKLNKNPFSSQRGTVGLAAAVGKWFTPSFGLRTKFQGLWMKQVNVRGIHPTKEYMNLHEDMLFNLSNMLLGYNDQRLLSVIPYIGVGYARNFSLETNEVTYNTGLLCNFRLSSRLQAFADAYFWCADARFDGNTVGATTGQRWRAHNLDKAYGLSLGVTYNLGRTIWEKAPDVDALLAMNQEQLDALQEALQGMGQENERLRSMMGLPADSAATKELDQDSVPEVGCIPISVFFPLGSASIASRKDLVNVKALAEFAKQQGRKVIVTGYADSKTGSEEVNDTLSRRRAQTLVDELLKMGVPAALIEVNSLGGVDTVSPFSYNRRATVALGQE